MRSPLADGERDRLIMAMLPDIAFDGWSQHALRLAAGRIGIPAGEAMALFPRGAPDMVAAFSRWADRQMLDRLETTPIEPVGSERAYGWEGCLSVPGLRGVVPRHLRVHYRGVDLDGNPIEREVAGFHARVVQHECDHLDGILYPQRMTDHRLLVFTEELQRYPIDVAAVLAEGDRE